MQGMRNSVWNSGRAGLRHGRGQVHKLGSVASPAATSVVTQGQRLPSTVDELPPSLRNSVVILDAPNPNSPGGTTKVYLLAMSHVSKVSVDQVKELVKCVQPDVVGVELCKDRVGLLVDSEADTVGNLMWHCRKISMQGLSQSEEWPAASELLQLLRCKPGTPISQADIEDDVTTLLSTGLFRSARPLCQNGGVDDAPAFLASPTSQSTDQQAGEGGKEAGLGAGSKLQALAPLGRIQFVVQERVFPPITEMSIRVDSSLKNCSITKDQLETICSEAQARNTPPKEGPPVPSLTCLLQVRKQIAEAYKEATMVVVTFKGAETGKVEILVRAARSGDAPCITGFESSATGGEGWGIEPFRPNKKMTKISNKMFLTPEYVEAFMAQAQGLQTGLLPSLKSSQSPNSQSGADHAIPPPQSEFRAWTEEEMNSYVRPPYPDSGAATLLGDIMTGLYARHQTDAARKVGLTPGSAWQAAMVAATESGAQQVLLIDRPTVVTEKRLADGLMSEAGGRIGAAAAMVLGTIVTCLVSSVLPETAELAVFAGSCGLAGALLWPLIGPILEVSKLAGLEADQIEDAVAVKSPIAGPGVDLSQPLRLFGEDALLDWPGALPPVIRERDTFMAQALAAAAAGSKLSCPAYVRDQQGEVGQPLWRLMMPEGGHILCAPPGVGDGSVKPLQGPKAVVGIVGSAHVRGMLREWPQCVERADRSLDDLLAL